jgi:succinate dehydrogenase flavin-adding protein (antitoxin of CptAB toxin-antitoxin module)
MNLKKVLASTLILSMFVVGCNKTNIKEESPIADEETQQKTMTKVQNDVKVIMGKDYEYVLKNMGTPYSTTYYIDKDSEDTLDEIDDNINRVLTYPKYTSDNELDGSALYIELEGNKVTEVQTYEFSNNNIETKPTGSNVDVVVEKYNEEAELSLDKIEKIKFSEYIGKTDDDLYSIVGDKTPNLEAYDKSSHQKIKAFFLKDKNNEKSKILIAVEDKKNIQKIIIVDKADIMNLVKQYLSKN